MLSECVCVYLQGSFSVNQKVSSENREMFNTNLKASNTEAEVSCEKDFPEVHQV